MTKADIKQQLISALKTLGVEIAGRHADHLRWSATDLATDLAPFLSNHAEGKEDMTRVAIFRDATKLTIQDVLKQRIVEAIRITDGAELDDICYVLTEQLVYWQLTLFKNLNDPRMVGAQETSGEATNLRGALCPYYIVYAGWYGYCPDGKIWKDTDWTYGVWSPQGTDSARAVTKLNEYQQQGYDFCGIEVAFNS